jgi:alkylhydroperoxidase/carboxymuconolactone decarboxylase family protein YurZ
VTPHLVSPPSEYLRKESAAAGESFRALRDSLLASGPLDRATCELIVIAGLATSGFEDSFKIHSQRLLDMDVPMTALRHAVMITLGGSSTIFQVARALQWLDEMEDSLHSRPHVG